jgi:hypothetical protein|nr:MAG TPA: YjcQ protein [Caudoviricetes sp.]
MKRDLDLIRDILLDIESAPSDSISIYDLAKNHNVSPDLVFYQIQLLKEAQFLKVRYLMKVLTPDSKKYDDIRISRLTLQGHDYLDTVRNNEIWSKTKASIVKLGTSVAFSTITRIASRLLESSLPLP